MPDQSLDPLLAGSAPARVWRIALGEARDPRPDIARTCRVAQSLEQPLSRVIVVRSLSRNATMYSR